MVIDRKHKMIQFHDKGKYRIFMTLVDQKTFYFTHAACIEFGLKVGKYLSFDNSDGKWSFWQTDDPDGFKLYSGRSGDNSVRIENRPLMKMFRNSTMFQTYKTRLFLMKTTAEVDGQPVIEIVTSKTFEELKSEI